MVLKELKEFTAKHLPKISKIGKTMIKENNLIPCHAESFLLGFQFEPVGIDGSGYLAMYKKPYVSKKTGKVSNYKPTFLKVDQDFIDEIANKVGDALTPSQKKYLDELIKIDINNIPKIDDIDSKVSDISTTEDGTKLIVEKTLVSDEEEEGQYEIDIVKFRNSKTGAGRYNNNVSIGFATDDSFRINVAFSNFDDGLEERTTKLIAFSSVDFEMSANDYILKLNQETGVIKTLIDRITALETQLAGKQDALTFTDITYTMDDGTVYLLKGVGTVTKKVKKAKKIMVGVDSNTIFNDYNCVISVTNCLRASIGTGSGDIKAPASTTINSLNDLNIQITQDDWGAFTSITLEGNTFFANARIGTANHDVLPEERKIFMESIVALVVAVIGAMFGGFSQIIVSKNKKDIKRLDIDNRERIIKLETDLSHYSKGQEEIKEDIKAINKKLDKILARK
ncbi:hypothetical protein FQA39_LY19143 [Lamprigera yunnana]|nr:hypothetical protein FQA39_LY19143 [Lamprigera yunnana]